MKRLSFYLKAVSVLCLLLQMVLRVSSQELQVNYLGIEKGLSNNAVTSVFQDHRGFMWFGTYDGLNRYDGYECTVFRNIIGDSTSLNSNNINSISEDGQHRLWIGGQKEINIYDPLSGHFSIPSYHFINNITRARLADNVISLQAISNNTILAGTQHNGLFYFDNAAVTGHQVAINGSHGKTVSYYVSAIKYDTVRKIIYAMVQNEGLFIYDPQQHTLLLKSNQLRQANCLELDTEGNIWLGDNAGVYRLNKNTGILSTGFTSGRLPVMDLCVDKKGALWIGSDGGGVWLLHKGQNLAVPFSTPGIAKPLINSNSVYAIYEDKQERKWVATLRGGVNILEARQNIFNTVLYNNPDNNSVVQNFILSFCEDNQHNIWIGTDGAGLRFWNRSTNTFSNYIHQAGSNTGLSSNFVTGIIKDGDNGLWISTWFGGINHLNPVTGDFKHYNCFNPVTKSGNNNVWALLKDSRQRLWASAVRNGGLYRFNEGADSFEMYDHHLTDLQSIAEDHDGNIWTGDYSSLIKIDTIHKKHTVFNIGYAVRSIYHDRHNNFWIGTQEGGLLLFDRQKGTYERFTTSNGLPHNTVLRILEDKTGDLWLSTYNGLSKFDPVKKRFKNFSHADGLQSNQFSFNAGLLLTSGELLFGGIHGFNVFRPDMINTRQSTVNVLLSGLSINNAPVQHHLSYIKEKHLDVIRKIEVPYNEADLSLDFLNLDYSNAPNISYAYYLQSWDKNWNYVKKTRTASYSRLHEGDYVFKVKTSQFEGEWSNESTLLYITVLPPWYRTWWAYCVFALLGASAIYLYMLYRNRQAKLQWQVRMANWETQQEKELNEKKISFFTNVSHEFRAPLSLIINPVKDLLRKTEDGSAGAELKMVYRNAQRLLKLVDQLLLFKKADAEDHLNLAQLDLVELSRDVFECFTEQARLSNIIYLFETGTASVTLLADREKIEVALFNILSNAFKYTPQGGEIKMVITVRDEMVSVTISDTGSGIPASEGGRLFERFYQTKTDQAKAGFGIGLYLVKKFAEAHEGNVSYQSELGKGSAFTITLPKIVELPAVEQTVTKEIKSNVEQADVNGSEVPGQALVERAADNNNPTRKRETILNELKEEIPQETAEPQINLSQELVTDKETMLVVDDDAEMLSYLVSIFQGKYQVYKSGSAEEGIRLAQQHLPDLILSDIVMPGLNGLDLCRTLKADDMVSHIPVVLLTGTSSDELQLESMQSGADDYIRKPFDKELLMARVQTLLKRRNVLQNYFFNEVTLGSGKFKVSSEYKEFLDRCMAIIEHHLTNDQFSIKVLAGEMGMSHSNLYKKVKSVSGQTVTGFIRYIRLKKSAEVLINTESNVNETAEAVGFNDVKYFRNQFSKLFGVTPSEYIKKYRKPFHNMHHLDDQLKK